MAVKAAVDLIEIRRCLVDCFRSFRLRLKRVFTKMEFSCCKKLYSIRYKLLHRTVTNQSTKHLLTKVYTSDGKPVAEARIFTLK